jgi:hypothetical protein
MGLYRVQNSAMPTTAPATPVTTSTTLYTSLQIVPAVSSQLIIVEWGVSFNGATLAAGFPCELVDTGTVAATVTAYAVADVMGYDAEGQALVQTAGTTGFPLNLGTTLSGYTSSAEGSATACMVHDSALVEPIGGYYKQFPEGREPFVKPGNVLRIRIKGDGSTTHTSYIVFEV